MKLRIIFVKSVLLAALLLPATNAKENFFEKLEKQTKEILQSNLSDEKLREKLLEQFLTMYKDILSKETKKPEELITLNLAIDQAKEMAKTKAPNKNNIDEVLNKIEYELIKKARYVKSELRIEQVTVEQIVGRYLK